MNGTLGIIISVLNILAMGAATVGFVNSRADASKYDPVPIEKRVGNLETNDAVKSEQIKTILEKVTKTELSVEEIKNLFYEDRGWNKPAVKAPIIKDANDDTLGL